MARKCSVCYSPDREKIEKLLLEKVSLRTIAGQSGTSRAALSRHYAHMLKKVAVLPETPIVALPKRAAWNLAKHFMELQEKAARTLALAEAEKNTGAMLLWFRELRAVLEAIGKLGIAQMLAQEANGGRAGAEPDADCIRYCATSEARRRFPGFQDAFLAWCMAELLAEQDQAGVAGEDDNTGFEEAAN